MCQFFIRICLDWNLRSPGRGSKCATQLPKYPSVKNSKYPKNTYKVSYNVKYNVPTHLICTALELNVFWERHVHRERRLVR